MLDLKLPQPTTKRGQFLRWLREHAWAKTAQGWRPFVITRGQYQAVQSLGFFERQRGWWAAVKARQVGFTTLALLWSLWFCLTNPGVVVLWVMPTDEIASEILQTFREMVEWHRGYVPGLEQGIYPDNARHSGFSNGSRIKWAVIGGTEGTADLVARGATCDAAVFSELAYPVEEHLVRVAMDALGPALERNGAPCLIDSTPNGDAGPGAPYHEMVCEIRAGQREGGAFLFQWWLEPQYSDPAPEGIEGTYDADERAGVEAHGWTPGQVAWRRRMRAGGARAREKFQEKYVESWEGAFLPRGGDHPVDGGLIRAAERLFSAGLMRQPLSVRELEAAGLRAVCADDPLHWQTQSGRGLTQVFKIPQEAGRTWAAIDCADGHAGSDWQALAVVDELGELAALAYLRVDPLRVAAAAQRLCEWYGVEVLVVESQKAEPALGAIRRAQAVEVAQVRGAKQGELEVLGRRYEGRVVVQHTTEAVHDEAMDAALRVYGEAERIVSWAVLTELRDLRRKGERLKARDGGHDDALMATGLAERQRRRDMLRLAARERRGGGGSGGRGGRGEFKVGRAARAGGGRYSYLK